MILRSGTASLQGETIGDTDKGSALSGAEKLWLFLALLALTAGGGFALALVALRAPFLAGFFPDTDFFATALVLHVDLAHVVWLLAFAGFLWSRLSQCHPSWGWGAALVGMGGALVMTLSPLLESSQPITSNYLPVLNGPRFFAGLLLFSLGLLLTIVRFWLQADPHSRLHANTTPPGLSPTEVHLRSGLRVAAFCWLMALLVGLATYARLPGGGETQPYFESLFWGSGHLLQFTHTLLMVVVWLWLGEEAGLRLPSPIRQGIRAGFLLTLLPALLSLWGGLIPAAGSQESRDFFTSLMSYGSWLAAPLPGITLLWLLLRSGSSPFSSLPTPGESPTLAPIRTALGFSILLFLTGVVSGSLIRTDNVMVTAHYHGTVGAVTLAFMGMGQRLLVNTGLLSPSRIGRWQPHLYGAGLLILIVGLIWSASLGVPRKTPWADHGGLTETGFLSLSLVGIGGLAALLGTFLFLLPALRAVGRSIFRARSAAGLPGSRPLALGTVVTILSLGILLDDSLWPEISRFREIAGSVAGSPAGMVPGEVPGMPAGVLGETTRTEPGASSQTTEEPSPSTGVSPSVRERFEQGAAMLHTRQYEYAAVAFHWVLQQEPKIPEAHVNMGFALLGLGQQERAKAFFNSALALRATQANAYYGLALAEEADGNLPEARAAMRVFLHLTPPESPHGERARQYLAQWESRTPEPTPPPSPQPLPQSPPP
ncbi:MAG: hypothetical protein HQL59_02380 [Magnetococcales bacterium]|nr:hypothetical protein [Magnetococcales bacterium]